MGKLLDNPKEFFDNLSPEQFKNLLDKFEFEYKDISNKKEINARDILLLLLYLPGTKDEINEPIIGTSKIIKMMFIFKEELLCYFSTMQKDNFLEFFAYNYGPFSKELLDNIRFLKSVNLIESKPCLNVVAGEVEIGEYLYDITEDTVFNSEIKLEEVGYEGIPKYYLKERGMKYVQDKIIGNYTKEQLSKLQLLKRKINTLNMQQILSYINVKYKDYKEEFV